MGGQLVFCCAVDIFCRANMLLEPECPWWPQARSVFVCVFSVVKFHAVSGRNRTCDPVEPGNTKRAGNGGGV